LRGRGRKIPAGRPGAVLWLAVSTLVASGCQLIGGGADPPPPTPGAVQGAVYQGSLSLDGGDLPAALEIIRNGGTVRGALQTTSGLVADGQGRLRGNRLTFELSYSGNCPGTMFLEGEWDEDGRTYRGTLTALDCTGKASGTFSFAGG
jgi:hypothetical protein